MDLISFVDRSPVPEPWAEGDNIPWNDPGFSQRMLAEHFRQDHDGASRRTGKIAQHVAWIHRDLLCSKPSRILDLGCGPGLYALRLAQLGHTCRGIDFSPASIDYAREQAVQAGANCVYERNDIRLAGFGDNYDLVMQIYGEFNVFRPYDLRNILAKAYTALRIGGILLFEASTHESVENIGRGAATWYSARSGLFSDRPHIAFEEHFWDTASRTATTRYFVMDAATADVTRYAATYQAYTRAELANITTGGGFGDMRTLPSLLGVPDPEQPDMLVVVARKTV